MSFCDIWRQNKKKLRYSSHNQQGMDSNSGFNMSSISQKWLVSKTLNFTRELQKRNENMLLLKRCIPCKYPH